MSEINCKACGQPMDENAPVCPHCGAHRSRGALRVWILTFFVMGFLMGLMLLLLQQGSHFSWQNFDWPWRTLIEETTQSSGLESKTKPTTSVPNKLEPMRCDRDAALAVREKSRELASISEQAGVLLLRLGGNWEYYSEGHRRGFIEAFVESDRCLQGHSRTISFNFRGDEVAVVSSEGAIEWK